MREMKGREEKRRGIGGWNWWHPLPSDVGVVGKNSKEVDAMIKSMPLQSVIALAARIASKDNTKGRVVVVIRPPYVPAKDVRRGEYDTAFGKTKVEGVWLDPEHGVWKVKVRFEKELSNPVLPKEEAEKLLRKAKQK